MEQNESFHGDRIESKKMEIFSITRVEFGARSLSINFPLVQTWPWRDGELWHIEDSFYFFQTYSSWYSLALSTLSGKGKNPSENTYLAQKLTWNPRRALCPRVCYSRFSSTVSPLSVFRPRFLFRCRVYRVGQICPNWNGRDTRISETRFWRDFIVESGRQWFAAFFRCSKIC